MNNDYLNHVTTIKSNTSSDLNQNIPFEQWNN